MKKRSPHIQFSASRYGPVWPKRGPYTSSDSINICHYSGSYPRQQQMPAYPTQPQQMQYQPTGQYGIPAQMYGIPPPPYSQTPLQQPGVPPSAGMYNVRALKVVLILSIFLKQDKK